MSIYSAGISDVRDESDRDGMRVVVEVKRGSSASVRFIYPIPYHGAASRACKGMRAL
jgi:hypothetical protein